MDARAHEVQSRYLRGERAQDIARDMSMSRARVYQLLQQAKADSHAHVQIVGISDHIDRDALAEYLRRALATAGIVPRKSDTQD